MGLTIADSGTSVPLLTLSVETEGADEKFRRFVNGDGTRSAAGDAPLGVCRVRSSKDAEVVPVDALGVVPVEAGAAIALVDGMRKVMPDAQGRAVQHAGGVPGAGWALKAAAAAGDIVPVLVERS